ncbi:MAG: hypothetical protein GX443_00700 [Deltaproteobacteria bacterium]|nr:hypothetical protein [Deltaproteobacteria bacterium]
MCAQEGGEVLKRFMEHEKEIDMVILDVVMPKRSGVLVCKEMLARTLCRTP